MSHLYNNKSIGCEVEGDKGFLLSNKRGSFFSFGLMSRYDGLFFRVGDKVIKTLHSIDTGLKVDELSRNNVGCNLIREGLTESYFMPNEKDALVYQIDKEKDIVFTFDVKEGYDNREWGRCYDVFIERGTVYVKFTKRTDLREDSTQDQDEYAIFLAIKTAGSSRELLGEWICEDLVFDRRRNSAPYSRYVYKALKARTKCAVIGFGLTKEDASTQANIVFKKIDDFKKLQLQSNKFVIPKVKAGHEIALYAAANALNDLTVKFKEGRNTYAGLPWFFQFWSRDSMISSKALLQIGRLDIYKDMLLQFLDSFEKDGTISNYIGSGGVKSADALGFLLHSFVAFEKIIKSKKSLSKICSKSQLLEIRSRLANIIDNLMIHHTVAGLLVSGRQESWMDSSALADGRKGARVEMQAMLCLMNDFMYKHTRKTRYKESLVRLKRKIYHYFWNDTYLTDGINDMTIRPNLFIAAYIYPNMLSKAEWKMCFDKVLPSLWCEWGGVATIDKNDPRYVAWHTGEDPLSYHSGDSWFWINDLVALVLYRTDYARYKSYVNKILEASSKDILFEGYIGCHSELSSAAAYAAGGCLSQAWSNALFVELVLEINAKKLSNKRRNKNL